MYDKNTLEKLLDLMPEYIFFRDIDGKNIYFNRSYAENLIGLPKDEIYGKTYMDLPTLKNKNNIEKTKDLEVILTKKTVSYEQVVQRADGVEQNIEINKYPSFDEDGNVNGIFGVIRDISCKRELDRLREVFFSNLSHELRTPLNMILSNIQLINKRCLKYTTPQGLTCNQCLNGKVEHIYNNSLRLLKLSNNFIDLAGIECGAYSFTPRNYELVNFVENICERINNYKKNKNIDLIFDTDTEELMIRFDYLKLEKAILNLISNAMKFNKDDEPVIVSITHDYSHVYISIKDNGIGIDSKKLASIFDPFYNVEDRLTKISEGSGVGLCLSKHLVEMHNGKLIAKSELHKGTEFIISIPNVYYEDTEIDSITLKLEDDSMQRIQMELSDIY